MSVLFRPGALALCLLSLWPPAAARAADGPLSLDEAIAAALAHSRPLQATALQVKQAEEDLAIARLRRRPVFSVNALASGTLNHLTFHFPQGAFGFYPATGYIPGENVGLTLSRKPLIASYMSVAQPLTQLYRVNAAADAKGAELSVQRERARGAAQEVVAGVRRLYYSLLQTESALAAADVAVDAAREVNRALGERATARTVLAADAAEMAVRVAQAERARLALAQALEAQKEKMNQLLGRDLRTTFSLVAVPEPPDSREAIDDAIVAAVGSRADVREARLRVEQAELDLKAKRSEGKPDVSATLTYLSLVNIDILPRNLAAAGVQVTWEPWDWGRRSRETAQKTTAIAQARLLLRDAEERVQLEVLDAVRALDAARADLRLAAAVQAAARERLRVRQELAREQVAAAGEVLEAQARLADATSRHQQALSSYWSARADFERAIGTDIKP